MKKLNKLFCIIFLMLIYILPVCAYTDKVFLGGENIGIEVKTKGVLVVGLYKVNNEFIASSSGIKKGDYIINVNDHDVYNINDFSKEIENDLDKENINIKYKHNNKIYDSSLRIINEDNEYKTGLYVKDSVSGIGTLTVIDPGSNRYLALGHAVIDSSTNTLLNIDSGSIYASYITGISKSSNGSPGEKIGEANEEDVYGNISKNTDKGIFGKYEKEIGNRKLMKVADPKEIVLGGASILTVLDKDKVEEFSINIDKIDYNDDLKNMLFTITDPVLLEKTGGIVQGMSGSPIIQNGKIIGAVTHVIVDDCTKGYGIFITNMLEESERE